MLDQQVIENCDRAQKYYRVGWEFAEGYRLIEQSNPAPLEVSGVKLHLLCHALEVSMKGWLVLREGLHTRVLKTPYGHNLR